MKPTAGQRAGQIAVALGKTLCYLLLFVGTQILIPFPFTLLAASAELHGDSARAEELYTWIFDNIMLFSALSGAIAIAVVLIFYLVRRKKLSEALWLRPLPAPDLLTGAALVPAFYLAVSIMLSLLPKSWQNSYSEAVAGLDSGGIAAFIAIVLVAPVTEELIFRGLILTRLDQAMPGWLAVLLSSAIFGALHSHPIQFVYAFALGCFFGLVDLRTGSILPSILAHLMFNLIGQIPSVLPDDAAEALILAVQGGLLIVAVVLPILDRRAIRALFRRRPEAPPPEPEPKRYDYDPWDT